MKILLTTVLSVLVCFEKSLARLSWTTCGIPAEEQQIRMTYMDIRPLPINLPGTLYLSMNASNLVTIGNLNIQLTIWRHVFIGSFEVPCLLGFGSCLYSDTCTLLDQMQTRNWGGLMGGIAYQLQDMLRVANVSSDCPIGPQQFVIRDYAINIPDLPIVFAVLASGQYTMRIQILDGDHQMMCVTFGLGVRRGGNRCSWFFGCTGQV